MDAPLVVDGDSPHGRALVAFERNHEGRLRAPLPDPRVELVVASRILLGVGRHEDLVVADRPPDHPDVFGVRQALHALCTLVDDVEVTAPVFLITEGHGPHLGLAGPHGFAEHRDEQVLERGGATHRVLEVEEQLEVPHAPLELLGHVEKLDVLLRHRHEEPRVVDAHGRLRGESRQDVGVVVGKVAALLVEDLNDADGLAQMVSHRGRQDRARAVAAQQVPLGVEPWIGVGVADVQGPAGARDISREALASLHSDRPYAWALRDARDELLAPLVEQVERRAVGLERFGQLLQDQLEQLIEVERRSERNTHLAQRLADAKLAIEGRPGVCRHGLD